MRLFEIVLWLEKLGCAGRPFLSGQPPQPIEMAVYVSVSSWLCAMSVCSAYPTRIPTPPWYSTAAAKMWLSAMVLPEVRSAPVASGMSTAPSSIPLPEMSVKTSPFTVSFCDPLARSSPAAPRWTKLSPVNCTLVAYDSETFAGSLVHAPYGQVPPGAKVHRPSVLYPVDPVIV